MKEKKTIRRLLVATALVGLLALSVAAAQGGEGDPLVTLGYLTEKFLPQVTQQVEAKAVERDKALESKVQAMVNTYSAEMEKKFSKVLGGAPGAPAATFVEITLTPGQKLTLAAGGELLFRSGTATCLAPSAPGLVDTTTGAVVDAGAALTVNHLYLATAGDRGLTAKDAVTALVRGSYTVA